jgi:hypothetical protein
MVGTAQVRLCPPYKLRRFRLHSIAELGDAIGDQSLRNTIEAIQPAISAMNAVTSP